MHTTQKGEINLVADENQLSDQQQQKVQILHLKLKFQNHRLTLFGF